MNQLLSTVSLRGTVRVPGVPMLASDTERYVVRGGGSVAIPMVAGDQINVIDREGLQPAELLTFNEHGKGDAGLIGEHGTSSASGYAAYLADEAPSAIASRRKLQESGIDLASGQSVVVFDRSTRAGDQATYVASAGGTLLALAPGGPMAVDAQNPPTEIIVYIQRIEARAKGEYKLPEPLADPLLDINIQPGNASGFEVRKGDYIQILDVQGRECSDFQAFDARALDKGLERDIDPTTTRSLMGNLYPAPGLYSKYYTLDHQSLIEIVRDTVGRHDTFGLACTGRYYDDMGYPGHLNCSENMNIAADPFGIAPRGGWPAINFFFNTNLDATNAITMDDPWSRPGDYVLLRAMTDLVCIGTACPCDIDPANGWNPTDIQVRTYSGEQEFSKAEAYRMTTDSEPALTKETGFHGGFSKHTQNFTEYNGYWLPANFPNHGAIAEYWACREAAVVMDLSPLRKFEVLGPDAEALMQLCVTRNMRKLSIGQVVYTAVCYEHGGMIDDGTVFRLGDNNFRWIGGIDTSGLWMREQAEIHDMDVWVKSSTDQMHNIAVQGPKSRELLKEIIWTPPTQPSIENLEWFRFSIGRIGDFHGPAVVVSRTGYTGELGFEIFCHPRDAEAVFDAVWKAGEPQGLVPFGLEALDLVRIEAGLVFAGYEFSDQTDPYEAGIGFTVPLKSKEDNFIGREALVRRKESPVRKLVGLDLSGNLVPSNGDCVRIGRAQVGEVTSATRSPILGKTIALCRMDIAHSAVGTEVEVGQLDGHQKRIPATVVAFPHFDPKKERVRV